MEGGLGGGGGGGLGNLCTNQCHCSYLAHFYIYFSFRNKDKVQILFVISESLYKITPSLK